MVLRMAVDVRSNDGEPSTGCDALNSIELFTGGGGLALGFESAGFRHLLAVELYARACESLLKNRAVECLDPSAAAKENPSAEQRWPLFQGPVQDVDFSPFAGKVDALVGGVPCQPWSIAGKSQNIEEKIGGERNLWPEMLRVASQTRPKVIIAENVIGLTRPSFTAYFEYILNGLQAPHEERIDGESWIDHDKRLRKQLKTEPARLSDRYVVETAILNAADYGVPQLRKRLFVVAYRADLELKWVPPDTTHSEAALVQQQMTGEYWKRHRLKPPKGLGGGGMLPDGKLPWLTLRDAINRSPKLPKPLLNRKQTGNMLHHVGWPGARVYRGHQPSALDWPSKTIKAGVHGVAGGEGTMIDDDGNIRYLTVREVARLMSFPDDWELAGTRGPQMRQLGNAVPVDLAKAVAESVRDQLRPRR